MGGVLQRTANACQAPRAEGDLQGPWVDEASRQQHRALRDACEGSLLLRREHVLRLGSGALLLVLSVEGRRGRTRKPVRREGKQVISRGQRGWMSSVRLKAWGTQLCRDLQCLGNLQKGIGFEQKQGEILC